MFAQARRLPLLVLALSALLSACGSDEPAAPPEPEALSAADLVDTRWELTGMTVMGGFEFEPEQPASYTLRFRQDNRLTGQSDCNTFTANWQDNSAAEAAESHNFQISNYDVSRSMCIRGSLHNYYSLYMRDVVSLEASETAMTLRTTTPDVQLQFRRSEP